MRGGREAAPILALMQQSVARMSALIDNVLDFARGRLGGGIAVNRAPQLLEPVLNQVVAELRSSFPDSTIETDSDLVQRVNCDGGRIAQLFSNLLGNRARPWRKDRRDVVAATNAFHVPDAGLMQEIDQT